MGGGSDLPEDSSGTDGAKRIGGSCQREQGRTGDDGINRTAADRMGGMEGADNSGLDETGGGSL